MLKSKHKSQLRLRAGHEGVGYMGVGHKGGTFLNYFKFLSYFET